MLYLHSQVGSGCVWVLYFVVLLIHRLDWLPVLSTSAAELAHSDDRPFPLSASLFQLNTTQLHTPFGVFLPLQIFHHFMLCFTTQPIWSILPMWLELFSQHPAHWRDSGNEQSCNFISRICFLRGEDHQVLILGHMSTITVVLYLPSIIRKLAHIST